MKRYLEMTSGFELSLPDNWKVDVGTIPHAALIATAQDPDIEGTNIVVTVEQPPPDFQDLVVYAQHQLERLRQAKPTARQIGARAYVGGDSQAVLGVHTYVLNNTHDMYWV